MLYRNGFAALAAISALGFGHCAASAQHVQHAPAAQAATGLPMPPKSDIHVAQLYDLLKGVMAKGVENVDHAALHARMSEIAQAHAKEIGADPAVIEPHLMEVARNAAMAAQADPKAMASLDSFYVALHTAVGATQQAQASPHGAAPAAQHGAAQTLQPGASDWKKAPQMREFYEATKVAFANGPKKVDAKAFEKRSREIFIAFADSMGAPREMMLDHLKDIPKQIVQIVKEDPKVLDSFDNFWVALSGPE